MNKDFLDYEYTSWQELLRKIYLEYLPLEYVSKIRINFIDNRVWEFLIEEMKDLSFDTIQNNIAEYLKDHDNDILSINVEIDVLRFKKILQS